MENTFQSGRAQHAYLAVEKAVSDASKTKEFVAGAKKLPMMIKVNGLLPALLFADTKSQFHQLPQQVMAWLTDKDGGSPVKQYFVNVGGDASTQTGFDRYIAELTGFDSYKYRQVTVEAQRYLAWVRRFADALKDAGDGNQDTQNSKNNN